MDDLYEIWATVDSDSGWPIGGRIQPAARSIELLGFDYFIAS
jgi:hypothetical protein